jgi:RNase adapter protein RapZ
MELVVISGMSGAGKATAAKALEESGFTVVDNLPPSLLAGLVDSLEGAQGTRKLGVVIDARSGKSLSALAPALAEVREKGVNAKLIFIDALDSVLVQRYSESRRKHPSELQSKGVLAAVQAERSEVHQAKLLADAVIDTSEMRAEQLREQILFNIAVDTDQSRLLISMTSFGFKFGLPIDADLVFDVRFLANPHYVDDLRPYDGRNKIIDEFVMNDPASQPFIDKITDLLNFALPRYIEEGKAYLNVAVGCTGGRHRSVVITEHVGVALRELGYQVVNNHRDVSK